MLLHRKVAIPISNRLKLLRAMRELNKQVYSASYIDYNLFDELPDSIFEEAIESLNVSMQRAMPKLRIGVGNVSGAKNQLIHAMLADVEKAHANKWSHQQALQYANQRAAFRATQTLNKMQASHKEETYTNNNILFFQWQSKEDNRVRARHAHLDGMVFAYAQPPIANLLTGERFLPGEDWGCRCIDIPIVEDQKWVI